MPFIIYADLECIIEKVDGYKYIPYKNISYISQFMDSARVMASSLSNLVNDLSEGIHTIKCKYGHDDINL